MSAVLQPTIGFKLPRIEAMAKAVLEARLHTARSRTLSLQEQLTAINFYERNADECGNVSDFHQQHILSLLLEAALCHDQWQTAQQEQWQREKEFHDVADHQQLKDIIDAA